MKKLVALLCMMAMLVSSVVMVSAAPSPNAKPIVNKVDSAVDSQGNSVEVTVSTVSAANSAATTYLNANVVDVKEINIPSNVKGPVKVKLDITGYTAADAGKKVEIYGYVGGTWKALEAVVTADGKVEVVALEGTTMVALAQEAPAAGQPSTGNQSPKTGESNTMEVVAAVVLVAICGMVISLRKRETV